MLSRLGAAPHIHVHMTVQVRRDSIRKLPRVDCSAHLESFPGEVDAAEESALPPLPPPLPLPRP